MEYGCLTFTTAPAPSRSATFLHHSVSIFKQLQTNHSFNPSASTAISKISSRNSQSSSTGRGGGLCVKASKKFISASKQTLSSNWNVSKCTAAPSWLPRFEELDTTNMLLRQRIIFLGSQIDDATADFIISQLLFLDAEDQKKDIRLFINSPGGSITAGMGIYDAMKLCKADVSTICMGLAASMGAFILAAGTKGKRFCMPNGRVMIHQPLGNAEGKATEICIRIREMSYQRVKMNKILSRITRKPEEQIEVDTERDNFMNPWEAKEYGLVDGVIDEGKPGLVAPIADAAPPPKTRIWDLWKIEGTRKAKKNLPSEERIFQNGSAGGQGNGEGQDTEQKEEAPMPS